MGIKLYTTRGRRKKIDQQCVWGCCWQQTINLIYLKTTEDDQSDLYLKSSLSEVVEWLNRETRFFSTEFKLLWESINNPAWTLKWIILQIFLWAFRPNEEFHHLNNHLNRYVLVLYSSRTFISLVPKPLSLSRYSCKFGVFILLCLCSIRDLLIKLYWNCREKV